MSGPWEDYISGPWDDYAKPKASAKPPVKAQNAIRDMVIQKAFLGAVPGLSGMSPQNALTFANGAVGGFLDRIHGVVGALTGEGYTNARDKQRALIAEARKAPGSSVAEVAGSALPFLAIPSAKFTKGAPMLAKAAQYAKTILPTAAAGGVMGTAQGNDLTNVHESASNFGKGALSAVGGDLLGRGAVRLVGGVLAPRLAQKAIPAGNDYQKATQLLANEGVDIMPLQSIGPGAKRLEEKLMSAPLTGDAIRARAGKQVEQLNTAAINRALKTLGQQLPKGTTGTKAMEHMQTAFNNAYGTARSGMVFDATTQFTQNIDDLVKSAEIDPLLSQDHVTRLGKVIDNLRNRSIGPSGTMIGDVFKKTLSDLKTQASKLMEGGNNASDQQLGSYLKELVDHIDEAARTNPASDPAAVALMDKADEGYAMAVRIEDAAKRRGGDPGTFTASQLDAAVQKADKTARNRAYLRGDALMQDLSSAGQMVLAPKVPDSGTAGRLMTNAATVGIGGYVNPLTLAPAVAGAFPYLIPGLLTKRPGALLRAGKAADKLSAPAGAFGASLIAGGR